MNTIFQELKPPEYQTVLMFTSPASNIGIVGSLLAVNQGNALVNAGTIPADYGNDCDYIRIAIGSSVVINDANYIAFDTFMPPNHMAQWQALSLQAGETLFVYSQKGQTSFVLTGSTYD